MLESIRWNKLKDLLFLDWVNLRKLHLALDGILQLLILEIVDVVRVRPHRHDALMLTKDENIVDVTVSVQYQIADPQKYVLDIRDDASLVQATESALRHVVGGPIMDDALTTGRELIAQEVTQAATPPR